MTNIVEEDARVSKPYPIFLTHRHEHACVVGAGPVGARKVQGLVESGVAVRIIAPAISDAMRDVLSMQGVKKLCTVETRSYRQGDVAGSTLVFAATGVRAVDEAIAHDAQALDILVNVAAFPELSTFTVPSVVRRGDLQIAIGTGGAAPALCKRIRKDIEATYGSEYALYTELLGGVRSLVLERVSGGSAVHAPLLRRLEASDVLERIAQGERLTAHQVFETYVVRWMSQGDVQ